MKHQFRALSKKVKLSTPIAPEHAQFYLDNHNTKNRKIDPSAVERYAQSMIMDKWLQGSDCISFDREGNLLNGQQRLMAVVKSKKTIEFDVKYGLPVGESPDDRGRKRSLADALRMSGRSMANRGKVMIALNFYRYENKWIGSNLIPDTEISSFIQEKEACLNAVAGLFQHKRAFCKAGFLTALAVFAEKDEAGAIEFGRQVIDGQKPNGDCLRNNDPAFRLREYLLVDRGGGAGKILENAEKTFYAIHMWVNNFPCPKLGRKTKLEL